MFKKIMLTVTEGENCHQPLTTTCTYIRLACMCTHTHMHTHHIHTYITHAHTHICTHMHSHTHAHTHICNTSVCTFILSITTIKSAFRCPLRWDFSALSMSDSPCNRHKHWHTAEYRLWLSPPEMPSLSYPESIYFYSLLNLESSISPTRHK